MFGRFKIIWGKYRRCEWWILSIYLQKYQNHFEIWNFVKASRKVCRFWKSYWFGRSVVVGVYLKRYEMSKTDCSNRFRMIDLPLMQIFVARIGRKINHTWVNIGWEWMLVRRNNSKEGFEEVQRNSVKFFFKFIYVIFFQLPLIEVKAKYPSGPKSLALS